MGRRANYVQNIGIRKLDDYKLNRITFGVRSTNVYQDESGYASVEMSSSTSHEPRELSIMAHQIRAAKEFIMFEKPSGKEYCNECGWIDVKNFSADTRNYNGLQHVCKTCRAAHARRMYWLMKDTSARV